MVSSVPSYQAPQGFGLPSVTRATAQASSPQASAASYVNQQLAGLTAGTSSRVGPSDPNAGIGSIDPTQQALRPQQAAMGKVALKNAESNNRVKMYQAVAARKRTLQQKGGVQYNASTNAAPIGQAWTPDGKLSNSRNKALALASNYLGTRYQLGGTTTKGIDCSGLVMMVYRQLGYNLPHDSSVQGRTIPGVRTNVANLRPGDIVAWKDGHHIAIYAGNGEIIEAQPRGTIRRKVYGNVYGIALRLPGE